MSTKLDQDFVRTIREKLSFGLEAFNTLVREVERLEGQVGKIEAKNLELAVRLDTSDYDELPRISHEVGQELRKIAAGGI